MRHAFFPIFEIKYKGAFSMKGQNYGSLLWPSIQYKRRRKKIFSQMILTRCNRNYIRFFLLLISGNFRPK
jgi:hypothetical protein